jgi:hypothetical protein
MGAPDLAGSVLPLAENKIRRVGAREATWSSEPTERQVWLLGLFVCLLFLAVVLPMANPLSLVDGTGDNGAYIRIASAIHHWRFDGITPKLFWGLPYAMAALAALTGVSEQTALLLISVASSFIALLLVYRLWGAWTAGFFAILNFDWISRSVLGGAEPLFVALLFTSFLLMRKERWVPAAALASLATVVRPLGIFALIGIGLTLLWKREYRHLLWSTLMGALIGGLYLLPMALLYRSPMANFHAYQQRDWSGGMLVDIPFRAIVRNVLASHEPWTNLGLTTLWMLVVLAGAILWLRKTTAPQMLRAHPAETIFFLAYVLFLFTYNSGWARADFPRFAIPILPFVLVALHEWLPQDTRVLWTGAAATATLAACSTLGIRNVAEVMRKGLGG